MFRLWRKVGVALLRFGRSTGSHGMTHGGSITCQSGLSVAHATPRGIFLAARTGNSKTNTVYNRRRSANEQGRCCREFTPASGRVVGSGLWQAKTHKSCSLASGRTPRESQSATYCFYRCPIVTTTPFALISNTSACPTIESFSRRLEGWNLRISRIAV